MRKPSGRRDEKPPGAFGRSCAESQRRGVVEMAKPGDRTVLFLCTGNYYRSRFAEIVFNSVAGRMGLPWRASSRGLALERGVNNVGPMAVEAIKALESMSVRAADAVTRSPVQVT